MTSLLEINDEFSRNMAAQGQITLKQCMQSMQRENETLRSKVHQQVRVIEVYKSRLSDNNLSTATSPEAHEHNCSDAQKILDSLSRENAQLRIKIQEAKKNKQQLEENIQAGVLPEEMQKIEELRKQNKDLKQQCQNVIDSNRRWQEYSNEQQARLPHMHSHDENQLKDRITLLEEQIKTCTEDFKSEERDKLELKRRCNDQDLKIDIYERQLAQFQEEKMSSLFNARVSSREQHHAQFARAQGYQGIPERHLVARGLQPDEHVEVADSAGRDFVDSPQMDNIDSNKNT